MTTNSTYAVKLSWHSRESLGETVLERCLVFVPVRIFPGLNFLRGNVCGEFSEGAISRGDVWRGCSRGIFWAVENFHRECLGKLSGVVVIIPTQDY